MRVLARSMLAAAAMVAACAHPAPVPVGRDFSQAAFAGFALDRTTVTDVEAALGTPFKSSTRSGLASPQSKAIAPGTQFSLTTMDYFYAPFGGGQPAAQHPSKVALLFLFNDRLMGYGAVSALPGEEPAQLDQARLAFLQRGITTRAQAIAQLGPPTLQLLHVFDKQPVGTVEVGYDWSRTDSGTVLQHSLRIFFDPQDRLSTFQRTDNTFPVGAQPLPFRLPAPNPGTPTPPAIPAEPLKHLDREHT